MLSLDFRFTDETVAANVEAAKENGSRLSLLTSRVPVIAGILGLLALVGGLVLFFTSRRAADDRYDDGVYAEDRADEEYYDDRTDQFFDEAEGTHHEETRASRRESGDA